MRALQKLLQEAQAKVGKTYAQISEETRYSDAYVRMIISGDKTARLPRNPVVLQALAEALDLDFMKVLLALRLDIQEHERVKSAKKKRASKPKKAGKSAPAAPVAALEKAGKARVVKARA